MFRLVKKLSSVVRQVLSIGLPGSKRNVENCEQTVCKPLLPGVAVPSSLVELLEFVVHPSLSENTRLSSALTIMIAAEFLRPIAVVP